MKTVTYKNRTYTIISEVIASEKLPNVFTQNKNIEFVFTAQGKRGSLVSGFITFSGSVILF